MLTSLCMSIEGKGYLKCLSLKLRGLILDYTVIWDLLRPDVLSADHLKNA